MAYKCRLNNDGISVRDFFLLGSRNKVTEAQYGYAELNRIEFPGVSTCTVLAVLLADHAVVGGHFALRDLAAQVDAIINKMNEYRNNRDIVDIYLLGVLQARSREGIGWKAQQKYNWPEQIRTFNAAFGRRPDALVYGYDQGAGNDQSYRALVGGNELLWFHKGEREEHWQRQEVDLLNR